MSKIKQVYYKVLERLSPEFLFWIWLIISTIIIVGIALLGNRLVNHFHPEWQYKLW